MTAPFHFAPSFRVGPTCPNTLSPLLHIPFPSAPPPPPLITPRGRALLSPNTAGLGGIGMLALAGGDVPALTGAIQQSAVMGPAARFIVGFPLLYHYICGIRHVVRLHIDTSVVASYRRVGAVHVIAALTACCHRFAAASSDFLLPLCAWRPCAVV